MIGGWGIAFSAIALSAGLTFVIRAIAMRHDFLDVPNARSSHHVPTPRGGGVAIVATFYASLVLLNVWGLAAPHLVVSLLAGLAVAAVGYIDDHSGLSVRLRLPLHLCAALWGIWWLGGWPVLPLGFVDWHWGLIGGAIAVLGLVWLTNFFNFMDGTDGLAAMEAAFVALVFAYFAGGADATLAIVLAASCIGFLCLNWPPASIFMGDVGSGFLGFVLGILVLYGVTMDLVSPWTMLIALGLFATDATLTLFRRGFRGERVWLAHRSHAYQWAARRYGSHRLVLLGAFAINVFWLLPCAIATQHFPAWVLPITLSAYAPLIAIALYLGAGKAEDDHV